MHHTVSIKPAKQLGLLSLVDYQAAQVCRMWQSKAQVAKPTPFMLASKQDPGLQSANVLSEQWQFGLLTSDSPASCQVQSRGLARSCK